jgi:hypothetical protein
MPELYQLSMRWIRNTMAFDRYVDTDWLVKHCEVCKNGQIEGSHKNLKEYRRAMTKLKQKEAANTNSRSVSTQAKVSKNPVPRSKTSAGKTGR